MVDKIKTIESKSKTRNGIKRLSFVVLSILVEVALILIIINYLYRDFALIEVTIRIITVPLSLYIYGQQKTASMKMPWILLILGTHVVGITLYLLVGLNGGTKKMKERYKKVDEQIFPLLPENTHVLDKLEECEPNAYGIAAYLSKYSHYPVYENTDVTYYDRAEDGLEAQLEALKQAEKFIFMEYFAIQNTTAWGRIEEILVEKAGKGVKSECITMM